MDLKTLLLRSISTDQVLRRHKRLHLGKKCFTITYEVSGKFLSVKSVKQVHTKCTFLQRLRRRRVPPPVRGNDKKLVVTCSRNLHKRPEMLDAEAQTPHRILHSRATETPKRIFVSKPQQTIHFCYRRQTTQTEAQTNSIGVQTDRRLISHFSQTEWCQGSMTTQTHIDVCNNQMQTELADCMDGLQIEKEAVIFLLNEIGEMINQNHLLHNNSTLLGQISEIMMLNKIATRQHNATRLYKKFARTCKIRRHIRFCGNYPRVCLCRKPYRWRVIRNEATQIDIEIMHHSVWTQTKIRKRKNCLKYCFS